MNPVPWKAWEGGFLAALTQYITLMNLHHASLGFSVAMDLPTMWVVVLATFAADKYCSAIRKSYTMYKILWQPAWDDPDLESISLIDYTFIVKAI